MSKKNLSDLLREEVTGTAEPPPIAPASPAPVKAPRPQNRTVTKAMLEQQVTELTQALAAATTREQALQTQVTTLQGDISAQQSRIFELKEALETATQQAQSQGETLAKVTQELEEAKGVIVKMTAPPPVPVPPPVPEPPPAPEPPRAALSVRMPPGTHRGMAKGIPEYAIQRSHTPTVKPSMLSDEDIGWVD